MKRVLICVCSCAIIFNALCQKLDDATVNRIVESIYKIENSKKYPYGIKSIPIKGKTQIEREAYARHICRNTVINNYQRWIKSGQTNKYFEFLGNRYCPVPGDKTGLNKNWINNLRKVSGLDL